MRRATIRRLTVLAATALAMVAFASPAWAGTFTVTKTADTNDGVCNAADCSLREAVSAANADGLSDTIGFALPGAGPQTITLADALTTGNDAADELTINGPGQNLLTVKQGAAVRVFQIVGKATINGMTISGGRSINNAGGILNGGVLTLNDTTVTGNEALGTTTGTGLGGGIFNASGATLTLNRSTVSTNDAIDDGGGIFNDGGALTLNDSTVSGNEATGGSGGGIYSYTNLTVLVTTIRNSTISDNTAGSGGGVYNANGLTRIENSTVTDNTAPAGEGSGVASRSSTSTRTEVFSTIISANANNSDVESGSINSFLSNDFNLIGGGDATAAFNKTGDRTGATNPGLGPLASNGGPTQTHAVLKGSRAIDRGPVNGCPATDQRGKRRPQNGDGKGSSRCDVGAYEKKTVR